MTSALALKTPAAFSPQHRSIIHHTRGRRHGPITRLASPGDLGEIMKPFVFLDLFDLRKTSFTGMGLHPHSGIATVTYLFEGAVGYEDTTGATGVLPAGGVEWFKAGGGAWHGGGPGNADRSRGFQLWVALPPDHELGAAESLYLTPQSVAQVGPAKVILGRHGDAVSSLKMPGAINYLAVRLRKGETWRYQPPAGHTVGWIALAAGHVATPDAVDAGELAVFEPSNEAIEIQADADSELVIGTAAPHRHDLVLGNYSVHTSPEALKAGEHQIGEIQRRLRQEGRL